MEWPCLGSPVLFLLVQSAGNAAHGTECNGDKAMEAGQSGGDGTGKGASERKPFHDIQKPISITCHFRRRSIEQSIDCACSSSEKKKKKKKTNARKARDGAYAVRERKTKRSEAQKAQNGMKARGWVAKGLFAGTMDE